MFNAIKQGVVHSLQQPPPDIEALRVYLLLPEFSIYQKEEQYDAIVIPFGEAILRLSVDAGKVLSEYENLMPHSRQLKMLNPFTARVNVGALKVVVTFESVDKIL